MRPPSVGSTTTPGRRRQHNYEGVRDTLVVLWDASDRVCGKRLNVMIPVFGKHDERPAAKIGIEDPFIA